MNFIKKFRVMNHKFLRRVVISVNVKNINIYYLIAGFLAVLFAFTHAYNGQSTVLLTPEVQAMSTDVQTIFTYVWHIITVEHLIFVIVLMSFQGEQSSARLVAWVIAASLIVRLLVILGVTALLNASSLSDTLIDSVAIVIYVTLIILGTTMKKKRNSGQKE